MLRLFEMRLREEISGWPAPRNDREIKAVIALTPRGREAIQVTGKMERETGVEPATSSLGN
jgi:hypothetical protein